MKLKAKLLLPSIADLIFLCIFLILALRSGSALLNDGDTGYHIRAGEYILETFSIPRHDIFSFISPPLEWTAHEWLSEVIMALVRKLSGLTGVVVFFSFVIAACYSLLFKILRQNKDDIILAMFLAWFAAASSSIHWLARPHVLSLLVTIVWYFLLDAYQYRGKNYLFFLPLIMLVWVNLHGGFMIGFFLLAIYCFGNFTASIITKDNAERDQHRQKIKDLVIIIVISLLASLVNPYGYHILLFPFKLTSNKFLMDHIQEFLSPNFHSPLFFKYLLLLMLGMLAISRFSVNFIELPLILLFTYMALYSARYISIFAIIISPILLRQAELLLEKSRGKAISFFKNKSKSIAVTDGSVLGYMWPIAAMVFVAVLGVNGTIKYNFISSKMPIAAVDFLQKEKISGNMFNNDEFGDYVIYAAWPQLKVFIDGRSDMYGSDIVKEYLKVALVQPGWKEVLTKYDINFVFFYTRSPISVLLQENNDWRLVYSDKLATVFVRNNTENRALIEKYRHVKYHREHEKESPADNTSKSMF